MKENFGKLLSPLIYPTASKSCLSFAFNEFGVGVTNFSISTLDDQMEEKSKLFQQEAGSMMKADEDWHQMNVELEPMNQPTHVIYKI